MMENKDQDFYTVGKTVFPKPLSKDEEHCCLTRLAVGDMKARNILIEHNLRLVATIANKFKNTGIELDDLISIGSIGLIKGINSYKLEKKTKLSTYTGRCIENEILMFLRRNNVAYAEVSLDEPVGGDDTITRGDILGSDPEEFYDEVFSNVKEHMLKEILGTLANEEKEIIMLRFGFVGDKLFSQKEVGEMFDVSKATISKRQKKILVKMRNPNIINKLKDFN